VGGADDPLQRGLAGSMAVVERALGSRLVDREHGARELSLLLQAAQADQASGGLLCAANQPAQDLAAQLVGRDQQVGAIIDRDLRAALQQRLDVLGVGGDALRVDGADLDAVLGDQRRGNVVLGRQGVGGAQRRARAARHQRQHQVRGLGGHVQAGGDPHARQRPLALEPRADLREHRHLLGRPADLSRAFGRQAEVGYVVRGDRGRGHPVAGFDGAAWISTGSARTCRGRARGCPGRRPATGSAR
jgi:hypothetical protein